MHCRSNPAADEVTLAFGPEGGWTDSELKSFQAAGWIAASLGSTILRAETAVIAATAIALAELAIRFSSEKSSSFSDILLLSGSGKTQLTSPGVRA